jgi:uncharacterized membrane protein
MNTGRLEAFTDGVIAIIITIMVLEIKVPPGPSLGDMISTFPILLTYALSFINVGILWNNHHHVLHVTKRIDGRVMWANLLLLFWMSLVPLVIRWIDESGFEPWPVATYGIVLAMAAASYILLEWAIIACNGKDSLLAEAIGHETKGKLSLALIAAGVAFSFFHQWIALSLYLVNVLMWFVPDKRIEMIDKP